MSFSENLKKLREAKGMTQKDLATKLGVSSRIVSYYETGKSIPKVICFKQMQILIIIYR